MEQRTGIFAGDDPFDISQRWLAEATKAEPNDPNAIALSTVDANGMPNARMVLLKDIEADAFVFSGYKKEAGRSSTPAILQCLHECHRFSFLPWSRAESKTLHPL